MNTQLKSALYAGLIVLGLYTGAKALFLSRLGGQAVYDTDLDITWLADANLAVSNNFGVSGIQSNGRMSWDTAIRWIDALNNASYLGYNDWRLPTLSPLNGINFQYFDPSDFFSGTRDVSFNVSAPGSAFSGSKASEMAYMYFNNLGNLARYDPSGNANQPGWGLSNTGPFINVQGKSYWFGLEDARNSSNAWRFDFEDGNQTTTSKSIALFAWAVRQGPVSPVPVTIDIKPGSDPNCINLASKGVVPVAILGSATFDVTAIDQTTLEFEGSAARQKGKSGNLGSFQDVDNDGFTDLVVQFPTEDLGLTQNATEGTVVGALLDGTSIEGKDDLCIVPSATKIGLNPNEMIAPESNALAQNYPNPFNPETQIRFQLPATSYVVVRIFNTLGQEIRTLTTAQYEVGYHNVRWDSKDNSGNLVSSGVYLYQLQAGGFSQTKKMLLIR